MGDTEEANTDVMQRRQSSNGTSSSSILRQPSTMDQLNISQPSPSQLRAKNFQQNCSGDGGKRAGIPPSHPPQMPPISPYSQIPASRSTCQQVGPQNFSLGPTHSRSLSQPSFFSLDSLPPLSPSPFRDSLSSPTSDTASPDVYMEDRDANSQSSLPPSRVIRNSNPRAGESLPPRKAHRRSSSDIPFGLSTMMHTSPPFIPVRAPGSLERSLSGGESSPMTKPAQLIKKESPWDKRADLNVEGTGERKSPEGEVVDDLFSAYMNLDNVETLNSCGTDDKNDHGNRDDLDSRASGTKTNGERSDNEAESSVNESERSVPTLGLNSISEKREGTKRSAGGDIAPTTRHYRSVSMDSFMDKLNFSDDLPKLPPSPGSGPGQLSPRNSIDGSSSAFSLEFGNGEFSGAELKKIMTNEKLAEIALSDPKRAKRILANRQSAARSKERKMRYISELEHKVQTLQTEATTLSAQLTLLQRDSVGLNNQNNELKFRLQAMEQQAQLRDALNEALTAEVQRLKLATADLSGDSRHPKCMVPQLSINSRMFQQLQQQQQQPPSTQLNMHLHQQHEHQPSSTQPQHQNGNTISNLESSK